MSESPNKSSPKMKKYTQRENENVWKIEYQFTGPRKKDGSLIKPETTSLRAVQRGSGTLQVSNH